MAAHLQYLDAEQARQPVPHFHAVYTLPGELRDVAYQKERSDFVRWPIPTKSSTRLQVGY